MYLDILREYLTTYLQPYLRAITSMSTRVSWSCSTMSIHYTFDLHQVQLQCKSHNGCISTLRTWQSGFLADNPACSVIYSVTTSLPLFELNVIRAHDRFTNLGSIVFWSLPGYRIPVEKGLSRKDAYQIWCEAHRFWPKFFSFFALRCFVSSHTKFIQKNSRM